MPLILGAALLFAFTYLVLALPAVNFISPTLSDNATTGANWVYINLSSSEPLNQSLLEWGNTSGLFANVSMVNSSLTNLTWHANMTNLADGACNYTVFAQNASGDWNRTGRRFVTVDTVPPYSLYACQELTIAGGSYILAQNVSSAGTCFNILADNITLDGSGYWINYTTGPTAGYAINNSGGYDNITIKNLNIVKGNSTPTSAYAIYGSGMANSTITNNNITTTGGSGYGIYLATSSNTNTLSNNTITTSGGYGFGIYLDSSSNTNITGNIMNTTNAYAIYVEPTTTVSYYNHTIDTTNTEQGKPIYYYFANSSITIENLYDIGQLYVTNSTNITIRNITVINKDGIILALTKNSSITNSNITTGTQYGVNGIYLDSSSNSNTLSNNSITTSGIYGYGIRLYSSSNTNTLSNNTISTSGSYGYGIFLYSSSTNTLSNNSITTSGGSGYGIYLYSSSTNTINDGSVISKLSFDYYWRNAGTTNNVTNTNWTAQRSIYFYDVTSYFNYNNETGGNIRLKTNVSAVSSLNRTLVTWSQSNMKWNDTNSTAGITANYNLTGLQASTQYKVYNTSAGTQTNSYTLTTDVAGALNFKILLIDNTEITVNATDTTPLLLTIQSPLNQTYSASAIWFNITANEALNWSAFSLDGAANVSLTNSTGNWNNLSAVADGFHNVTFYANDTAGNKNASAARYFSVDTTAPSITLDAPRDGSVMRSGTWINLTVADLTGVNASWWSNDTGATNTSLAAPWDINTSGWSEGDKTIDVWANDSFGFLRRATYAFRIDDTAPYNTTACQNLDIVGGYYTLTQNVSSSGTCFNILANNITLDGAGFTVNYSRSVAGYGVNITNRNNVTVRNLNVVQGNSSTVSAYAIYGYGMTNSTIFNNTIITSGSTCYGIHLYSSSTNTLTNNTITTSGISGRGIFFEGGNTNIMSNNIITTTNSYAYGVYYEISNTNTMSNNNITTSGSYGYGIYLYTSGTNTITGGSVISKASYDYYLRNAGTTNNVTNTNFTASRRIYFYDITSYFNYNNETNGNIWLKTNVSATSALTRTLVTWSQSQMKWNDTNSTAGIIANYNMTGLQANTQYKVYNISQGVQTNPYTLSTDSGGNLPSFTIFLNGNTEINVSVFTGNNPPTVLLNLPINGFNQTSASITFNCTAYDDLNLTNVTLYNSFSGWQANGTNSSGINNTAYTFARTAPTNGTFTWNCLAYDNSSQSSFASQNFTVTVDGVPPTSYSPDDASYSQWAFATIGWILYDNYAAGYYTVYRNGTLQNQSTWANNTNLNVWVNTSTLGTWNYTIAYNDSLGNNGISDTVIINITGDLAAPKYSLNSTNSTIAGMSVMHSLYWTDDVALSGYIFSFDNGTGIFSNDSWVAFTGTGNWSDVTKTVNSTVGAMIRWRVFANDTSNNWNASLNYSYVTTNYPPTYSNTGTNNTIANQSTKFYAYWQDDAGLLGFIFSTNNTGTWVNYSLAFSGTGNWSNYTITLNATAGLTIGYRFYANDIANQWNDTGILTLVTTSVPSGDGDTNLFWVRKDGNDTCTGQQNLSYAQNATDCAWLTVQKAANTVSAGDTVHVLAGTYNEKVTISRSGTASSPIIFQGEGTVLPTIEYTGAGPADGPVIISGSYITITGFKIIAYDTVYGSSLFSGIVVSHLTGPTNLNISNNYIKTESGYGICVLGSNVNSSLKGGSNSTIYNNEIHTGHYAGIVFISGAAIQENIEITYNTIYADENKGHRDSTAASGIWTYHGLTRNLNVSHNKILHSAYTAIKIGGSGNKVNYNEIGPDGFVHNAIETTMRDSEIIGNRIYDTNLSWVKETNVFYPAGDGEYKNLIIRDNIVENSLGQALVTGSPQRNVLVENFTAKDFIGRGVNVMGYRHPDFPSPVFSSDNLMFVNVNLINFSATADSPMLFIRLGTILSDNVTWVRDENTFINPKITGSYTRPTWWLLNQDAHAIEHRFEGTVYVINSNKDDALFTRLEPGTHNGEIIFYYYADVKVVDTNGNPIVGVNVSFAANDTIIRAKNVNYTYEPFPGTTQNISYTFTGADGHIPLPSNASWTVAIVDFMQNYSGITYYTWNITASKDGYSNSTTVNPSASWYRSNPNTHNNTITIVLPLSVVGTTLNSPANSLLTSNSTLTFNCSASSSNQLTNITLYGNWSGWSAKNTTNITGTSNSSQWVNTLADGSYIWNCLAYDNTDNSSFAASNYTFTVDTTPPMSVINLTNQSAGAAWIYWNWTNPSDAGSGFNHTEVWLNRTWKANTSNNYYNATELNASAWYEIQTRTADAAGNVNASWINSSAKTLADTTPPTFSLNSANTTIAGTPVNFSVKITDDVALSGYIFSTNNTGNWINTTWTNLTSGGTAQNITTLNTTAGLVINYTFYANDSSDNWATGRWSITTTANNPPRWSGNASKIASPATYNPTANYGWQINSSDENMNNTFFQLGRPSGTLTNYSASNNSAAGKDVWYYNLTQAAFGGAGTYNITWFLNDTLNAQNKSETVNYAVNQAPLELLVSPQTQTITYGASVTQYCSNNVTAVSCLLYRNSSLITNNTPIVLGAAVYNFTANITDTANYTVYQNSSLLTANKAATSMRLWLNGTENSSAYQQNQIANFTAQLNISGKNITLRSNYTGFADRNGTQTIYNYTILLTAANYSNITAFWSGDENYTASQKDYLFNVTADTTPPIINITNPANGTALAAGTVSTWINITTDENATCRYNLTNSTFNYADGANFTVTGNTSHWFSLAVSNGNTYSLYYKCNDTAGNINSQSTYHTFSVAAAAATTTPSSGGGGGGGSTTVTKSIAITPQEPLTKIIVNLKTAVASPAIFVAKLASVPAIISIDNAYQYLNITKSNFNNSQIENATIDFAVNKSWLAQNNITSVYLARYENGWNKLKTDLINSTGAANQYRAHTDAFSYFAIAGEKAAAVQPSVPENITQPAAENETAAGGTQAEQTGNWQIYAAIIIAAAALAAAAFALRKQIARAVYCFLPENRKMLKAQKKRFEEMKAGLAKKDRDAIKRYLDEGCAHLAKAEMDEAEGK